jgi:hypothetical protein
VQKTLDMLAHRMGFVPACMELAHGINLKSKIGYCDESTKLTRVVLGDYPAKPLFFYQGFP